MVSGNRVTERMKRLVGRALPNIDLWILIACATLVTLASLFTQVSQTAMSQVVLALLAILAISQLRSRQQIGSIFNDWASGRSGVLHADFPAEYYEARASMVDSYFFSGLSMARTLPTIAPDLRRVLDRGGSVRILLPNPYNEELMAMIAATRPDSRNPKDVQRRILHALREARAELTVSSMLKDSLELKVSDVLPRVGINAIDVASPSGLVMVQMYQMRHQGEPAPILAVRADDQIWFDRFHKEVEQLWQAGAPWVDKAES